VLTNKGCIITCAVFFCVCLHGEICVPSLAFLVSLIHACRREALLEARRLNSYDFLQRCSSMGDLKVWPLTRASTIMSRHLRCLHRVLMCITTILHYSSVRHLHKFVKQTLQIQSFSLSTSIALHVRRKTSLFVVLSFYVIVSLFADVPTTVFHFCPPVKLDMSSHDKRSQKSRCHPESKVTH